MPLDHIGIDVADYDKSRAFYTAALAPLGLALVHEDAQWSLMGVPGKEGDFVFAHAQGSPTQPIHIAFTAQNRAAVDAFYKQALLAGGKDNGGPGIRPQYHAHYYAAFIIDPDGHNLEAVCHQPV